MAADLILVTGATGFLGQHLVPQLLADGLAVRALVRSTSQAAALQASGVELAYGDIRDGEAVDRAISGCRYVIHAAGYFRFWGDTQLFEDINLGGARAVCQAAVKNQVERLVHISTIAVVGDPAAGEIIDENTPCRPQDGYQRSKCAAEQYILAMVASHGLPAVILRPGAYFGPGSRYGFNRLFIEEPMRGWRVKVDGGRRLTFPVFVPDVARAARLAIRRGNPGEIYNISGDSVTHDEVNRMVSPLLGISAWRLKVNRSMMIALAALMEALAKLTRREPFYPLNLRHYVFNDWQVRSEKARSQLGFEPTP
ncbi:MAG: NAD-dependent epimerase/dehydratase family protein, partial [Anaerolineae bacterium]|nr:NAD-dependent epimerase/dehydratase family protein [Anaerolineae bacterium]